MVDQTLKENGGRGLKFFIVLFIFMIILFLGSVKNKDFVKVSQ